MKLLLFSDLHLDTPFAWAGPQLARERRQSLRDTLATIVDLARAQRVDALLCGGDLYEHERFSPDTGEFLRNIFASVSCPVLLAPGNHDWYSAASLYAQLDWPANVHIFTADRLEPYELSDGFTIWGGAHRAPANTDNFLDSFAVDRAGLNVALFHGSETGSFVFQESGKAPHAPFAESQIAAAGLDHALLGHFHRPKDAKWHTYPGNPDPLAFGETGDRAAVLATFSDDGTLTRTRFPVASTAVHDVEVTLVGATNTQAVREQVTAKLSGLSGVARVTIRGDVAPELDLRASDLEGLAPAMRAVVVRIEDLRVGYDMAAIAAEKTVRGQFVADVLADAALDEQTRRRVLITGLRALDGRSQELEVH